MEGNVQEGKVESTPPVGFGHSRRRIAVEIAILAGVLVLLVAGTFAAASALAGVLVHQVPVSADEALGETAWGQLAPESERCTQPETVAYVQQLAGPLVDAIEDQGFRYRFAVVGSPEVNAYALPGGFVTVNMGLLESAESGEEIAGVLAHELQHVRLRHGTTRMLRAAGGRVILGLVLGWGDIGVLAQYAGDLVDLSYDRDQEREADEQGRRLLMAAGIDPGGMGRFFERLEARGGPGLPPILTTHPGHQERVAAARADAAGFTPTVTLPPPPPDLRCR